MSKKLKALAREWRIEAGLLRADAERLARQAVEPPAELDPAKLLAEAQTLRRCSKAIRRLLRRKDP